MTNHGAYLVVWTNNTDGVRTDHWCAYRFDSIASRQEALREAETFYDSLLEKETTHSASVCLTLASTDYF
jgi:LPS sulfotransferase NodH